MTSSDEAPAAPEQGEPRIRMRSTTVLLGFLVIILAFTAAGLHLSAGIKLQKSEERAAIEREALERRTIAERAAMVAEAKAITTAQAAELLKMMALPLSWAVRQALLEKGYREIALYFQQLVGLANVHRAALVTPDGIIKVASDKKIEGRPAAEIFPNEPLGDGAPAVRQTSNESLRAVVPIMGLNNRLGTLIVEYRPQDTVAPPRR